MIAGCQFTETTNCSNGTKSHMTKSIFIKEIITIHRLPKLCPSCQKEDRLIDPKIREERSSGKTILCTRCESLIVETTFNLKQVELTSLVDDNILLKEPHLIRKVTY